VRAPSPRWAAVLGVLVTLPALHAGLLEGTLPLGTALLRCAVAVAVVHAGLLLVAALVHQTSPRAAQPPAQEPERTPSGR
jgi:hypothetical protein